MQQEPLGTESRHRGDWGRVAGPSGDVLRRLEEHPWEDTLPRLLYYADSKIRRLRWLGERNGRPPRGAEAGDIVHQAIEKVFDGRRRWDPLSQPELLRYLLDLVDSEVSNLVTLAENRKTRRLIATRQSDEGEGLPGDDFPDTRSNLEETALDEEAQRQGEDFVLALWESLAGETDLQEIVDAIVDDVAKPAEIARRLGVRVDEIYARKKRLRHRLEAYQDARKGVQGRG
jgi:DNA-directed RNA polymerase specialized sigma24 family protein